MPFRNTVVAVVATILCLSSSGIALAQSPEAQRREIAVTGSGEASAAPDMATATFTVERNAPAAREALTQANQAMEAVVAGMKQFGIEARDLQTSNFGISPQYSYSNGNDGRQEPPKLVGYQVQNSLSVRIRDLSKTGDILDRAVTLGANAGGGIAFDIDDPAALRLEAQRKAVTDATATATAIAGAAGVALGDVVSVDVGEDALPPPPVPMMRMAMEAPAPKSSVPVEVGETVVRASVRMRFAIADTAVPRQAAP